MPVVLWAVTLILALSLTPVMVHLASTIAVDVGGFAECWSGPNAVVLVRLVPLLYVATVVIAWGVMAYTHLKNKGLVLGSLVAGALVLGVSTMTSPPAVQAQSAYCLLRDGSLPMTGNLDMGGNNITNAATITATSITTASIVANASTGNAVATLNQGGTGDVLVLNRNGNTAWIVNNSGHLLPGAHNVYDVGSNTVRVRNLYLGGVLYTPQVDAPVLLPPANGWGDIGSPSLRFNKIYAYGEVSVSNGNLYAGNWLRTWNGVDFIGGSTTYTLSGTGASGFITLRDVTNSLDLARWKAGNPTDGNTSMLLLVNTGGTITLRQVSVGGADSCGAGYRCLLVPN